MWRALLDSHRPRLRPWRPRAHVMEIRLISGDEDHISLRRILLSLHSPDEPRNHSTPSLLQQLAVIFSCSPSHIFVAASDCARILHHSSAEFTVEPSSLG